MIGNANEITPPVVNFQIEITDNPSEDWLNLEKDYELREIFSRTPASYISISDKEKIVARGRIGFDNSWGILTRIFVNESFRGQGLGETIVRAAADIARSRNIRQLALHVDADNVSAIALYSKLGFQRHHVVRFYQNRSKDQ
jgi:ribosomal protein S18 acetylase RimI-like enzyme